MWLHCTYHLLSCIKIAQIKRNMRVLTKSRFKQALGCPNKLFYTKKKEYANAELEDSFLQSLAEGGFQVEELARMYYDGGVLIDGENWNYESLATRTKELLTQENVIIYEAAFLFENLFIRTDILVKRENHIELIEVKAKSYDPVNQHTFTNAKGNINGGWTSYLMDLAFQKHVTQLCMPNANITAKLMLADKTQTATVDGLNQLFRIAKDKTNRTGIIKQIDDVSQLGTPIITTTNVDGVINEIIEGKHEALENMSFLEAIAFCDSLYQQDQYANWPVSWTCKGCEFKVTHEQEQAGMRSGFKECFSKQLGWTDRDFEKPTTFEIWNFRRGSRLFEEGKVFLEDITEEELGLTLEAGRLSTKERQWLQVEKSVAQDDSPYVLKEELTEEINQWKYPLNFIDFETSTVALPMFVGMKPYEQIAFQFSHHVLHENGQVEHFSEYINTIPGAFPNFEFIRVLQKSLDTNQGSIFRYATHENTIVNAIYDQLMASNEPDKKELCAFIKTISVSKNSRVETWQGDRNMIDLCETVKKYYYHPYTKGSNSIKAVLPAILNTSTYLQEKYSQPIKNIGVSSKNFEEYHVWLEKENNKVKDPYKTLPPLFDDWEDEEIEQTLSGITNIDNGGQALTAYGKLQYVDMSEEERTALKTSLLKYCELDTLAMVMIFEEFRELVMGNYQ
ncbi:DUF2779 domain-containing protein [Wenyingzhuangia sp. 1_MG-2023]|nr:DUF2779 domain-containing protein [Wenyingzhuangia sp. 1_MG-2023]